GRSPANAGSSRVASSLPPFNRAMTFSSAGSGGGSRSLSFLAASDQELCPADSPSTRCWQVVQTSRCAARRACSRAGKRSDSRARPTTSPRKNKRKSGSMSVVLFFPPTTSAASCPCRRPSHRLVEGVANHFLQPGHHPALGEINGRHAHPQLPRCLWAGLALD